MQSSLQFDEMDLSSEAPHSVAAIFARAERVFESRVDQLLQLKRIKARAAGTTFNARKAKRDARTVAGREKLDALVRRLADLATVQEKALGEQRAREATAALDSATGALIGVAALAAMGEARIRERVESLEGYEREEFGETRFEGRECGEGERRCDEGEVGKDLLDTSSCSDDCSVGGCLAAFKDFRDANENDTHTPSVGASPVEKDGYIFPATESVVNFVLGCEDEYVEQREGHCGKLLPVHRQVDGFVTQRAHVGSYSEDVAGRRYVGLGKLM